MPKEADRSTCQDEDDSAAESDHSPAVSQCPIIFSPPKQSTTNPLGPQDGTTHRHVRQYAVNEFSKLLTYSPQIFFGSLM